MVIQSLLPDDHIDLTHAVEFRRSSCRRSGLAELIEVESSDLVWTKRRGHAAGASAGLAALCATALAATHADPRR